MALKVHKVQTKYGPINVFNDRIGKTFISGKYYEKGKIDIVLEACDKKRTAVDVGANYGSHALAYSNCFDMVVAYEPQPELIKLLRSNLPKNSIAHMVALAHENGPGTFSEPFKHTGANYGAAGLTSNKGQDIELRTLDSYELKDVDLIKIDVEGFERLVIFGAKETIRKSLPVILFENHQTVDYSQFSEEVEQFNHLNFLFSLGYTIKSVGKMANYLLATQS